MVTKKKVLTQRIYFPYKQYNKRKIMQWCKKNDKEYGINIEILKNNDCIKKSDKEYQVNLRPKSKFKKTTKQHISGIKIIRGYLK